MEKFKYPSTPHIQKSKSVTVDDIVSDYYDFVGMDVVITEKMDGENTTLYPDGSIHARSLDSLILRHQTWIANQWRSLEIKCPDEMRIVGENLYAKHSIYYDNLKSYFNVFSMMNVFNDYHYVLDWETIKDWCKLLDNEQKFLITVPIIYIGKFDVDYIENLIKNFDTTKSEGFVIRNKDSFEFSDFKKNVKKWVRPNHVQSEIHWKKNWTKNNLQV